MDVIVSALFSVLVQIAELRELALNFPIGGKRRLVNASLEWLSLRNNGDPGVGDLAFENIACRMAQRLVLPRLLLQNYFLVRERIGHPRQCDVVAGIPDVVRTVFHLQVGRIF